MRQLQVRYPKSTTSSFLPTVITLALRASRLDSLDAGHDDATRFRPEAGRGIAAHYGRGFEASTAGSNLSPKTLGFGGESRRGTATMKLRLYRDTRSS